MDTQTLTQNHAHTRYTSSFYHIFTHILCTFYVRYNIFCQYYYLFSYYTVFYLYFYVFFYPLHILLLSPHPPPNFLYVLILCFTALNIYILLRSTIIIHNVSCLLFLTSFLHLSNHGFLITIKSLNRYIYMHVYINTEEKKKEYKCN